MCYRNAKELHVGRVERPFAYIKQILNYQRCSYYDLKRNRFEFIMATLVYNIRKFITAVTLPCSQAG
ncbi:MAG: transposase [Ignavibacterium sp.]